ncbi:MAG: hypothetical protein SA339_01875 [Methanomassiliicoccus sp.]|nr:hypothetical protein [Methanomassiliicoccus sp.]
MSDYAEVSNEVDGRPVPIEEIVDASEGTESEDEEERTSLWLLVGLTVLAILLIWILLGVWRYFQVLGHGAF